MVAPNAGAETKVWNNCNKKLPVGLKIFNWPVEYQRALLAYETEVSGTETQRASLVAYLADMNLPLTTIRYIIAQRETLVRARETHRRMAREAEIRRQTATRRNRGLTVSKSRNKKRKWVDSWGNYYWEKEYDFDKWSRGF